MCISPKALSTTVCFVTLQALCGWPNLNVWPYLLRGMLTPDLQVQLSSNAFSTRKLCFGVTHLPWTQSPELKSSSLPLPKVTPPVHVDDTIRSPKPEIWKLSEVSLPHLSLGASSHQDERFCVWTALLRSHPGNAGHSLFSSWFTTVVQVPHLLSNRQPTNYSCLLKILYLLPPRVSAPRPVFLTSQPRPIRIRPSHSLHHILLPKQATCGFLWVSRRGSAVYMPMLCTFVPV